MNKRLLISAVTMAAFLAFSSCSRAVSPDNTTTSEITTTVSEETSETTAEVTEASSKPYDHTFNPHVISQVFVDKFGKEFEENYYRYCDAVLTGADSVKLDKQEYLEMFINISRTCLPIVAQNAFFFADEAKPLENCEYELKYNIPKDEYLKSVDEFKARVEYLIESVCLEDDSDLERALALYISESARIDYDYDAMNADSYVSAEGYTISPYRALMTDKGICQEIAGAYAYLLLQVGIDATTASGLTKDSSSAHEWTIAKLDGKYYHCDVTFQCTSKYSVNFFGMNDAEREKQGDWDMEYINIGDINQIWHKDLPIEDNRFEQLWKCFTCFLDRDENKLFCYDDSGTEDSCYYDMSVA